MLIVGERINSTRKSIQEAIKERNTSHIAKEARSQFEAGAQFIDINCAVTTGDELQDIDWVLSVVQSDIPDVSICIDSPNHHAIERALSVYRASGSVMINSITAEEERIKCVLPIALKYKAKLIALTMDETGMPDSAAARFAIAKKIFTRVRKDGFDPEDLYFDPLVRPISTEPIQAKEFIESLSLIKGLGPVKTICGLSNVSFGLPHRSVINATFLSMAIERGLDAAIIDPLDKNMISSLLSAEALLGRDEYCGEYIKAFRAGKLK